MESLGGKKSWKQSILHLDKPLADYDLFCSVLLQSTQSAVDSSLSNTSSCRLVHKFCLVSLHLGLFTCLLPVMLALLLVQCVMRMILFCWLLVLQR